MVEILGKIKLTKRQKNEIFRILSLHVSYQCGYDILNEAKEEINYNSLYAVNEIEKVLNV